MTLSNGGMQRFIELLILLPVLRVLKTLCPSNLPNDFNKHTLYMFAIPFTFNFMVTSISSW